MTLQSYVDSFSIVGPAGNVIAGTPIDLAAVASEILDIPTFEVIQAPVDLKFLLKHLQLPLESGEIAWPSDAPAGSALSSITSGLSAAPLADKVEGWAGAVTGTVPIGVRDISELIRIEYAWTITYVVDDKPQTVEVIGGDLTSQNLTIVVPPFFREMTSADFATELTNLEGLRMIHVGLTVTGRIGNTPPVTFTLPPIPIPVLPIPLPSVAALFRDENLSGDAVLVMVRADSPLGSASKLLGVLTPLKDLLNTVRTAAALTSWAVGASGLFGTVTALADRIPLTRHVAVRARDQYDDLGHDNFIEQNNWFDTDIEDRGSSALIVSATQTMTFFQHDDFEGETLTLDAKPTATLDRLAAAAVRKLHVSVPQSDPPGCVRQSGAPDNNWGDKISSYKWNSGD